MRGNQRLYVVGLTGGIASGKSHAAKVLRGLGAQVLDADEIARGLTLPGGDAAPAVLERFGTLDRRAIASVIFADEAARRDLNAIVHPLVHEKLLAGIAACSDAACVVDVPLLYESGMEGIADEVWVVHVPRSEQVRRILKRDKLTEEEALARIDSQMPTEEKLRRADVAIDASGPKEVTCAFIERAWQEALRKAEENI